MKVRGSGSDFRWHVDSDSVFNLVNQTCGFRGGSCPVEVLRVGFRERGREANALRATKGNMLGRTKVLGTAACCGIGAAAADSVSDLMSLTRQ